MEHTDVFHSACFTGHRLIAAKDKEMIKAGLISVIHNLYDRGIRCFLCGGALGFDMIAAETVINIKKDLHDICLEMIIPCDGQCDKWKPAEVERFNSILQKADRVIVLSPFYYDGCMLNRNHYLVDHSDICLCYMKRMRGGTAYTVSYALKSGLEVINLAMNPISDQEVIKEPTCNYTYIFRSVKENVDTAILFPTQIINPGRKRILIRLSVKLIFKGVIFKGK